MTVEPENPRVFVSHATEDKERFVLPFAERLRIRGVDAWVDTWEMLPGDSLVGKIFREGLERATAVIVVLSRVSVTKRWVTEELDAAVVKRINEGSKLIPIALDGLDPATEAPSSIRHLVIKSVPDTNDLDEVIERVLRSIFGVVHRPPLGDAPAYVSETVARIPNLDRIDALVLRAAGAEAVRDGGTRFHTEEFLGTVIQELTISEAQAVESLDVLDSARLVNISRTFGRGLSGMRMFELTASGLETYLRAYEPQYATIEATVLARLAVWPSDQGSEAELSKAVGAPALIVQHVLDRCRSRGLLRLSGPTFGSGAHFFGISPRLRRLAEQ